MSLDGYIAGPDDNIDFLSTVDVPEEDYGYFDFVRGVDTVIWGRRTYDKLLTFGVDFPHPDKKVYVISRTRTGTDGPVEYHGDVAQLVRNLKTGDGKDIYCDGGGEVVTELLRHRLIDRLIVSILPHLTGGGIRLFHDDRPEQALKFKRSVTYPSGLVQLWYDAVPDSNE